MKSHAPQGTQSPTLTAAGFGSQADVGPDAASSVAAIGRGDSLSPSGALSMQTVGAGNGFAQASALGSGLGSTGFGGSGDAPDGLVGEDGFLSAGPEQGAEEEAAFQARADASFGTKGEGLTPPSPAPPEHADAEAAGEGDGALEIDVANYRPAPGGDDYNRTVVGVGEEVTFWASEEGGTWSASGGLTRTGDSGELEWTAPSTTTAVQITYTQGERTASVTMTVLAPMAMSAEVTGAHTDGQVAGQAGAGMDLALTIHPLNVSFYNVLWLEQPGGASQKSGYFARYSDEALMHHPNEEWLFMGSDNRSLTDTAAFFGAPAPFGDGGSFTWVIPNLYKVPEQGGGRVFFPSVQHMTVAANGDATVSKFGQSASRSP